MAFNLQVNILSKEEIQILKEKMHYLLSQKGIRINHPEILTLLKEAGAQVDDTSSPATVTFPDALILKALQSVPESFTLAGQDPQYDLHFPHPTQSFYARNNTGGMNYIGIDGRYHAVTQKDAVEWTRLSHFMENVDFCSLPSITSNELSSNTIDIHTLSIVLKNTTKHIWIQPYGSDSIPYLIDLAALAAGGHNQLRSKPIVSFISCSATPLEYKYMDMEVILQSCRYGIPVQACSLPTSGANVPITIPGAVLLCCTEVLAQIIICQVLSPGLPVIATPLPFALDMMSTATIQSSIEVTMMRMAAIQLFTEGYHIPTHTYGMGTDSFTSDGQAMIESTSIAQMTALSGAAVLGGAGQVETAKTISPIQLIIDNDILGITKHLKQGFEINDETLAWEDIWKSSGREGFLATDHTFRHFREIYHPSTFHRLFRTRWEEIGSKTIFEKAMDIYHTFLGKQSNAFIPEDMSKEMDKIIEAADRHLSH